MRSSAVLAALLPILGVQGINIVQGNDDGWAEMLIRQLNQALRDDGHSVILSAPADNQSGKASKDEEPEPREDPCMYDSCPANSGPTGTNETDTTLYWVNSYPVTGVRYGIDTFGPQAWDGSGPDLVVTGPNAGSNLVAQDPFSGTVGAAVYAVNDAGIPAIAFSALGADRLRWDTDPVPSEYPLYAELSTQLIDQIVESGTPYLPEDVFLSVNFPAVGGNCTTPEAFSWVLSRIYPGVISEPDVETCGDDRLPVESTVVFTDGCYISVSMGDATDKTDINDVEKQQTVLDKLSPMLTCLP